MKAKTNKKLNFPMSVLEPLVAYLKGEEKKLREKKMQLKKEDPYKGNRDDDNSVDADVAEMVDHDTTSVLGRQVSKALINIRKTLSRIRLGKYGICENCGQMIDTDRLAIDPTAAFCIKCQNKVESKKK